jgi:hypothetical protein
VEPALEPLISNSKIFLARLVRINVEPALEPLISNSKIESQTNNLYFPWV